MKAIFTPFVRVFGSLWLSITLLMLVGLLTWLGTLEQVNTGLFEVQRKYFESFYLIHHVGPLAIPLPGANLVLCLLFVNLVTGGIVKMRKDWSKAGILIAHSGILFLLLSGFIKLYFSEDGHVTLYEDESADFFQSYYRWEIVITRNAGGGEVQEFVVPQESFADLHGSESITLTSSELPFDVEVSHYMPNCRVLPKGPMFEVDVPVVEGMYLRPQSLFAEAEANTAGAYVAVVGAGERQEGLVWGLEEDPWTVDFQGAEWAVGLRKERYPMPFTVALDKFTKEDHPRMSMPRVFASDVTVVKDGASRTVRISMNEPLRDDGLVLYQASWGPSNARPGDPLFSTLSVVRNPADQYPLYACIVISIGLIFHFSRTLTKYIRKEGSRS